MQVNCDGDEGCGLYFPEVAEYEGQQTIDAHDCHTERAYPTL